MKEVKVKLYQYHELKGKAKERAKQWLIYSDNELFDADDFRETVLGEHAEYVWRLKTPTLYFSLNYCQGDGVAFYGSPDMEMLTGPHPDVKQSGNEPLRRHIAELYKQLQAAGVYVSVTIDGKNNHYNHWNSMSVHVETSDWPDFDRPGDEVRAAMENVPVECRGGPVLAAIEESDTAMDELNTSIILLACDWLDEHAPDQVNTSRLRLLLAGEDKLNQAVEDLRISLDAYLSQASKSTEKVGYKELEYRQSDEYIDEVMEANEYTFTKDGEHFDA